MKKAKINIILILIFLILPKTTFFGQDVIASAEVKNEDSYIYTSINYISDAIFMGRKDSFSTPYLYPTLMYHHKSGLYGKGSLSYLTKPNENRLDLVLATVGIDFNGEKFNGDISTTKYFFNENSNNVISQVETDITASFTYNFTLFNISLDASNYFSNNSKSDFFLSTEISHDFSTANGKVQFSPTIAFKFGSQNFYQEFYINRQIKKGINGNQTTSEFGPGTGNSEVITEVVVEESEKFKMMAIQLSMPIWYIKNSFTISFLPTLAIPQSETTIIVENSIQKENLKEIFYWILGIGYKFN